jgi:hypothetical protein
MIEKRIRICCLQHNDNIQKIRSCTGKLNGGYMKISAKDIEDLLSQYQPQFIVDENDVAHMLITDGGVKIPIPVPSQQFTDFINDKLLEADNEIPSESMLKSLMRVYAFRAKRGGERKPIPLKVAWADDYKSIIYDLNHNGDQIKITEHGLEKVNSYIVFRAGRGVPVKVAKEGSPDVLYELFDYINISDEDDRLLYLCTIVSMLVPDISHAILGLSGLAGTGKTTATDKSKMLIDPWMGKAAQMPPLLRTLEIAVNQQYVSGFDNISVLSNNQSDFICRCTTGSSCMQKQNYTDSELVLRTLKRCFILNGIERCEENADLLQRCVIIELDSISEGKRQYELGQKDFEERLPVFRAAIFTLMSKALDLFLNHKPNILPKRLSDYTLWSYCFAESLHEGYGKRFLEAYDQNVEKISQDVMATKPFLSYLTDYLASLDLAKPQSVPFKRFYNSFYDYCQVNFRGFQHSDIPSPDGTFSHYLRIYLADIERQGYRLEFPKRNNKYQPITISRIQAETEPVVEADFNESQKPIDISLFGTLPEQVEEAVPGSSVHQNEIPPINEEFKTIDIDGYDYFPPIILKAWTGTNA